ncbi:hypothetical protein ACOFFP_11955, partial [Vagococcus fluvialis]
IQSIRQGYINEQARPCVFFVSMLRSRHSKRHEHTGENEPPKRKKKGTRYVEHSQLLPFEENSFTSSNA